MITLFAVCNSCILGEVSFFAMTMMPIALVCTIYALRIFLIRGEKIKTRDKNRYVNIMYIYVCMFLFF